jgi:hypothetical protein
MLPSRRLVTILPRRTFTASSIVRLAPRCNHHLSHPPQPQRPSVQARPQHPSQCCCRGHQIRQNSSEASSPAETKSSVEAKIPRYVQAGDWLCSHCMAHNYRTRMICFECQAPSAEGRRFYIQGSWNCPTCSLYTPRKSHYPCSSLSVIPLSWIQLRTTPQAVYSGFRQWVVLWRLDFFLSWEYWG